MKKTILSIIKGILISGAAIGILALCACSENFSEQLMWSLGWGGEVSFCSFLLCKIFPEDFGL